MNPRNRPRNVAIPDQDLPFYRRRTLRMLKRYMRTAIDVGRLPSILGREFFRSKISYCESVTFEDAVILVHDVERLLNRLSAFDRQIIALMALEEYSQNETAKLMGCARRTIVRRFPEVLDELGRMFLEGGWIDPIPDVKSEEEFADEANDVQPDQDAGCGKACQDLEEGGEELSHSEETENVFWKNVSKSHELCYTIA